MKCPKCQSDNEDTKKFCRICGAKLQLTCPHCGTPILSGDKFCGECGLELKAKERLAEKAGKIVSERKHVTALFVDVSGYTTLSERLDPEEVKDIVSHLFGEVAKVITKYDGVIEKFAGDAVMALFGVPRSHEDDPIRAIRAAKEIHQVVGVLSPGVREKIGQPLSVHIGINTGLVVTGEAHLDKLAHAVAGDTLNVASRLCSLAKADETLVGQTTYHQAEGFFSFEKLEPVMVKGKTKPVPVYKLLSPKELPSTTKRLSGVRADLIGRHVEMARLKEAVEKLLDGQGSIISICGEAGTGKSRLIEEFKATLDLSAIQWQEGHAYAFTQNIPYYPLIDLLSRTFQIEESDPPELARENMERWVKAIVGDREDVLPYLGGLLSLHYPEVEAINPDVWKFRLRRAVMILFSALVRSAPTIIYWEDLHWADPSSLELLRFLLVESHLPALFLCVYRPPLNLFPGVRLMERGEWYQEVLLQALSPSETQQLVGSLLGTEAVPPALQRFTYEKVGGNPFYVEEVINSLIDSEILIRHDGNWDFTGTVHELSVPATVQGVIMARLDRLDAATKVILQEASVIGRTFYLEVLEKITVLGAPLDQYLHKLEELDLVRVGSTYPDLEYTFKHALIQEAVYNGLLKKDRKNIHERIGLALEEFFGERSSESWEALAFHFKRGRSVHKAVDYLVKSGEKSLRRYALEEAHQYYQEAFDLLAHEAARSKEEVVHLIDLLIEWCLVFYYQGRFQSMTELLLSQVNLAESLDDKAKVGAFYAWLGFSYFGQGARLEDSYRYLHKGLELGEQTQDQRVIAYACAFFIKTCAEMGYLEEGARFEERAEKMMALFPSDAFLHLHYFSGKGYIGWFSGDKHKLYDAAQGLLDYGEEKSSLRCQMGGHLLKGVRHFMDLDLDRAIECAKKVLAQGDPYHIQFARAMLGMFLVHRRQFEPGEKHLTQAIEYGEEQGTEYLKTFANMFLGVALAAQGNLGEGIKLIESSRREFMQSQRNIMYCLSEYILGSVYLQIAQRAGGKGPSFYFRNLGFLLKNAPRAKKKAEQHLTKAVQLAKQFGAKGFLGEPCLQLGVLFKLRGQQEAAKKYLLEAVEVFKECELEVHLKRAQELLDSLG